MWLTLEGGEGHCVLKWGFTLTDSWESRSNIEINVSSFPYNLVFEVPYWPCVKWMSLKKAKTIKNGNECLNISFFVWFTHWWNLLCETDWLGIGNDIKEILRFYKMSSDFDFTVTIWFIGNVRVKPGHYATECLVAFLMKFVWNIKKCNAVVRL